MVIKTKEKHPIVIKKIHYVLDMCSDVVNLVYCPFSVIQMTKYGLR